MSQLQAGAALPAGILGLRTGAGAGPRRARLSWASSGAGIVLIVLVWELLAVFVFAGKHVMPTPVGWSKACGTTGPCCG